ncbi:DUF6191 domain-containing protein [Streptomyces longispororuber]|uniref:DUF6191 domain-containing protein n=1 Tax=Streptomyces longispororuber TaxID=68230 RepID=UPI00210C6B67|nr:DUF6191 domain-containing protein [Streptomyces longispororuber]MCQ4206703.1 DUF6191 domain-containing protein [Streptomyces longispororuber]
MFNMFEELFAPGRKHTNDERKRLELTRVDLNDGDPGRGPIDLTSGKVVVRVQQRDAPDEDDHADGRDGGDGGDGGDGHPEHGEDGERGEDVAGPSGPGAVS